MKEKILSKRYNINTKYLSSKKRNHTQNNSKQVKTMTYTSQRLMQKINTNFTLKPKISNLNIKNKQLTLKSNRLRNSSFYVKVKAKTLRSERKATNKNLNKLFKENHKSKSKKRSTSNKQTGKLDRLFNTKEEAKKRNFDLISKYKFNRKRKKL